MDDLNQCAHLSDTLKAKSKSEVGVLLKGGLGKVSWKKVSKGRGLVDGNALEQKPSRTQETCMAGSLASDQQLLWSNLPRRELAEASPLPAPSPGSIWGRSSSQQDPLHLGVLSFTRRGSRARHT